MPGRGGRHSVRRVRVTVENGRRAFSGRIYVLLGRRRTRTYVSGTEWDRLKKDVRENGYLTSAVRVGDGAPYHRVRGKRHENVRNERVR